MHEIAIYTDGSCNCEYKIGGWASLLLVNGEEILLNGIEENTTNNRMELLALIKALEYIKGNNSGNADITVYSDSQYLIGLKARESKLTTSNFITAKGKSIRNIDLVLAIFNYMHTLDLQFVKVKAHQRKSNSRNINREVDKLSRKIVRDYIKNRSYC